MTKSVLISGAGIAGPSLAYWLSRSGYQVTVVERSPGLRTSGTAVDFRGDQLALLERMGVLADIQAHQTGGGDQLVVDAEGRKLAAFPSALFSGELEINRGDLSRILYDHTKHDVEYVFDDHVTAITQSPDHAEVTFASGTVHSYDLVVGADGEHSAIRRLAFDDGIQSRRELGYYAASFTTPNTFDLAHDGLIYNEPGRYLAINTTPGGENLNVSLIFSTPPLSYDRRDLEQQKTIVTERFADVAWKAPDVLAALRDATDLYLTPFSQVRLNRWSTGRVVLLGDAAWCAGPGGNGTGHAMLGAYTLAGELAAAGGDYEFAYTRYEHLMRPPVEKSQKFATGSGRFLAPPTERKIRRRNRTYRIMSSSVMTGLFTWLSTRSAKTGALEDYPLPAAG